MIASQLLLVSVWIVSISSGLTASVGGPNFAIEANRAEADTSRGLRALAVEEKSGRKLSSIIPFMTYRRKIVRSKKGLETIEKWDLNQDQVVSLHKFTAQLTEYEAEIQQQFKWLGKIARNVDQITQDLPQAEALFNKIKQGVTELKHCKLMLLGEVYNRFPDEIFGLITESLSRNLVQLVKEFITEQNHLFSCLAIYFEPKHPKFQYKKDKRYRFYTLTPLDYAFKIIDFLFENGFISTEEVREIFQDENMVYQVVNYTVRRYENDLGFFSWRFMLRCIGDVYLLLYDASRTSRLHDRLFPYEKYFSKSNALDASNSLGLLRYQHRQIGHQIYPELNVGEMNEIIQQLLPRSYYDVNLNCIVDLFAFMEEELCPGIVSQLLKNEHLSNQFKNLVKLSGNGHKPEDVFHLALIYSRNEMICHSAKQLIKSIFLDQETRTQFYILRDKEIYQDHIEKKREILTRRQDTYLKLSSVGTFHDQNYRRHQMLYPHFVEEDLTKMIAILDHTIDHEEMRRNLIEKKQKPYARRAQILDDIFS
ncbi:hypothetical protein KEM48_008324 [Puccinia striiformis f. sp. tritici PST-130]|nr:hypothetical protein KEM48_008324 [Puccinia striiformis f. sp. tritici PST-130]